MKNVNDAPEGCRVIVVACHVMEPEIEMIRKDHNGVEIRYLDQGLHRTPKNMARLVQEQIDQASEYAERIVLGYGLCSNGIVGVTPRHQGLIVPRCHDCIAFSIGSPEAYEKIFEERPGTYYITPGWVAEKKDPLSIVEYEYEPRYGRDTAIWVMEEELKNYTHIVLIDNHLTDIGPLRERAIENASFFKKQYEEIKGSVEFFKKILRGPYNDGDFLILKSGQAVTQEMFL